LELSLHSFLKFVHTTSLCYLLVCLPRCLTSDSNLFSFFIPFYIFLLLFLKSHLCCH
jgi:hypothetical protein